ncbi:unnamed protein product [Rhizophagus irregularis]|nr:unnamed protein product [Rhizophagus irregularis]CAB4407988.1 unnamed protein product [Rhizophagus irregularis]
MSRSIGPNEDHKGDIRLLGAWNSDGNIRRRVSSLDFKRRSALRIFRDGFRFGFLFRLRILALDMVFPVFWKLSFEVISVSEYRTCRNGFLRICCIGMWKWFRIVSEERKELRFFWVGF